MTTHLTLLLIDAATACLLGLTCCQDWLTRSISWPVFPALGGLLLLGQLLRQPLVVVGEQLLLNAAFLLVMVVVLSVYVRVRFWPAGLRLRDCLGSGDILFWLMTASYFSLAEFLVYFLVSCLVALLVTGVVSWHLPQPTAPFRVPLAGIQAACLLVFLTARWALTAWGIRLLSDNIIIYI